MAKMIRFELVPGYVSAWHASDHDASFTAGEVYEMPASNKGLAAAVDAGVDAGVLRLVTDEMLAERALEDAESPAEAAASGEEV